MDNSERISAMKQKLEKHLSPSELIIEDESHHHAGHAGAREGKGHFRIMICSKKFQGLRILQQHRLVYDALGEMMQNDIHALSIQASIE